MEQYHGYSEESTRSKTVRRLSGTAKVAVADMEANDIIEEIGTDKAVAIRDEAFAPYLEQTVPRAFEKAVCTSFREKGQTMLEYTFGSDEQVQRVEARRSAASVRGSRLRHDEARLARGYRRGHDQDPDGGQLRRGRGDHGPA